MQRGRQLSGQSEDLELNPILKGHAHSRNMSNNDFVGDDSEEEDDD